MKIKLNTRHWNPWLGFGSLGIALLLAMVAVKSARGQTNLKLSAAISYSMIQITIISNAIPNARYDLFGVVQFPTGSIPWTVIQTGAPGQTSYSVSMSPALSGFFVVATNDLDKDGFLNFDDGNSSNTNIHELSIYIESPTNGATLY
jgi:hypothetical protein